jgi:hypothetical protein
LRRGVCSVIIKAKLRECGLSSVGSKRVIFAVATAVLLALAAALVLVPNRYWDRVSKRLTPPEKYKEMTRPDPWG